MIFTLRFQRRSIGVAISFGVARSRANYFFLGDPTPYNLSAPRDENDLSKEVMLHGYRIGPMAPCPVLYEIQLHPDDHAVLVASLTQASILPVASVSPPQPTANGITLAVRSSYLFPVGQFGYVYRSVAWGTEVTATSLGLLHTQQDIDAAIARAPQCNGGYGPLIAIVLSPKDYSEYTKNLYTVFSCSPPTPKFKAGDDVIFIGKMTGGCPVGQIGRVGSVTSLNGANAYYFDAGPTSPGKSGWCAENDLVAAPSGNSATVSAPTLIIEDLVNAPKAAPKKCECGASKCGSNIHSSWCEMA